jgi:peptidoglycan L-alanyl-D-glutamate endopeptidase CwlK
MDYLTLAAQVTLKSNGLYKGKLDGMAGPMTDAAVQQFAKLAQTIIDKEFPEQISLASDYQPDARSLANINTLLPTVRGKAIEFLRKANDQIGPDLRVKIISGMRTYAEQNALYAKGRTAPGPIVTNARGGYSNHNFGVAFDVGIFHGEAYIPESNLYKELGKIGKSLGLAWGGDWASIRDEPHFEYQTGLTLAQMRERVAKGQSII